MTAEQMAPVPILVPGKMFDHLPERSWGAQA